VDVTNDIMLVLLTASVAHPEGTLPPFSKLSDDSVDDTNPPLMVGTGSGFTTNAPETKLVAVPQVPVTTQ